MRRNYFSRHFDCFIATALCNVRLTWLNLEKNNILCEANGMNEANDFCLNSLFIQIFAKYYAQPYIGKNNDETGYSLWFSEFVRNEHMIVFIQMEAKCMWKLKQIDLNSFDIFNFQCNTIIDWVFSSHSGFHIHYGL